MTDIHIFDLTTGTETTPPTLLAGDDRTTTPSFAADGATIVAGRHPVAASTDDRIGVIALLVNPLRHPPVYRSDRPVIGRRA